MAPSRCRDMASPFRFALNEFETRVRARDWRDTSDIRMLADWLDTRFEIPGVKWRFGFDSIVGLIPGIGDLITTMLGGYIVYRAHELGAPKMLIARMLSNLAIDSVVGACRLRAICSTSRSNPMCAMSGCCCAGWKRSRGANLFH